MLNPDGVQVACGSQAPPFVGGVREAVESRRPAQTGHPDIGDGDPPVTGDLGDALADRSVRRVPPERCGQ